MTRYGNEWRVFGGATGPDAGSVGTWSFVNARWAEGVVAEARRDGGLDGPLAIVGTVTAGADPGELLRNPVARAEHDLQLLRGPGGMGACEVLARLHPELRRAGPHAVRRLRRMCASADVERRGVVAMDAFLGHLSYFGTRLTEEERCHLSELFEIEPGLCDYKRFFALMQPSFPRVRASVVEDAYAKLRGLAVGGLVEADLLCRHWNPNSYPGVQQGLVSKTEARSEFVRQWEITSADGLVSYEVFLDYYKDVSTAIECDETFIEFVRCGWGL